MGALTKFNDAYDDAEVYDEFSPIQDGTYQVFVDEVAIKETKESKLPMLAWKFKVMSGNCEGRVLFKNSVINDNTLSYIKTDLSICELELERFSDLYMRLEDLLNIQLEVKVVTKGENQNIYIQRKISITGNTAKDDDIPF